MNQIFIESNMPIANQTSTDEGAKVIGQRIATIRKERGLGQVDVAEKLGIVQSLVSRYERGEFRIHAELLCQLADILDVTPNDLLGYAPDKNAASISIPRRLQKRLANFDRLPKKDQDSLIRVLDAILEKAERPPRKRGTSKAS
jgi:transcriptional regulator with XRE-family HTH domain